MFGFSIPKEEAILPTDQEDHDTCVVHALTKAFKQCLSEQKVNIDLTEGLASFLTLPTVGWLGGNWPTDFHGARITCIKEQKIQWPGSVELSIRRLPDVTKFREVQQAASKDTKYVLNYTMPKAGAHCVFISGVENINDVDCFKAVNSWGSEPLPVNNEIPSELTKPYPQVEVMREHNIVYQVRARWSPEGCDHVCKVCFSAETQICSGCLTVHYCSDECVREDWAIHQRLCRELGHEFEVLTLEWPPKSELPEGMAFASRNIVTDKVRVHYKVQQLSEVKNHSILKVQKQFDEAVNEIVNEIVGAKGFLNTALTVYSQGEDIYGYIGPTNALYSRLKRSIEDEGTMNYKVYVNSYQKNGKLLVNPKRILHPRSW